METNNEIDRLNRLIKVQEDLIKSLKLINEKNDEIISIQSDIIKTLSK